MGLKSEVRRPASDKRSHAVILSAAKDPGSSLELVNRVNYRGSSPKVRAQNDSVRGARNEKKARKRDFGGAKAPPFPRKMESS